jgi:VWFA-related protein
MLSPSRFIAVTLLAWLAQGQPQQPPRFRTEANFVRVDVYASKSGVAVTDLTRDDFEVFEDNTPQRLESFEHITVDAAGPPSAAVDPASPSRARELAADPRRRVFVVYLDLQNVPVEGSAQIKEPLIHFLQQVVGGDDLVAVMTPYMSADQLTFARRTQVIERGLRDNWSWGRRDSILPDEQERHYQECFPPASTRDSNPSQLAQQMSARRKERMVLDSLHDLVHYMGAIREGRTAVITVTDGWLLYGADPSMTKLRRNEDGQDADPIPGTPPPVGVGRGGTLTNDPRTDPFLPANRTVCERELMQLAMLDDGEYFRTIYGEANRANVSFYTIDPRGLVVFDTAIGPQAPPPILVDRAMLKQRGDVLHRLAVETDGLAMSNSNDLPRQLATIAADLTSYYLIGYRSTNGKLDGKYRTITVRSKRSGVEIRARHGYVAPTAAEAATASAAADAPAADARIALAKALGAIDAAPRVTGRAAMHGTGEPLLFHRGPSTGNQLQPSTARVFPRSDRLRLELEAAAGGPVWSGVLLDRNGNRTAIPVTTAQRIDASTGQRWLAADITLAPLGAGDYVIELTVTQGTESKKTLVGIRVTQ